MSGFIIIIIAAESVVKVVINSPLMAHLILQISRNWGYG